MGRMTGGPDPRIITAAVLAQQQAGKCRPGIPLISDEEAERRQRKTDASRRRRAIWRRVLAALVALVLGARILLTVLPLD